jgi:hypothetical protein
MINNKPINNQSIQIIYILVELIMGGSHQNVYKMKDTLFNIST